MREKEVLSYEQEDLLPTFLDRLFLRLLQRYGEEDQCRTERLSRIRIRKGYRGRTQNAEQLLH